MHTDEMWTVWSVGNDEDEIYAYCVDKEMAEIVAEGMEKIDAYIKPPAKPKK